MYITDFKHLEFLAETEWGLSHLKEFLYQPNLGLWRSSSPDVCSDFYDAIKRRLRHDEQLINFLDLHLFTEALVYKDRAADWFLSWVREHIHIDRFLPEIPWSKSLCGHWCAAPVLLVHERAYLRYFILGLVSVPGEISLWPRWAERLMDESSRKGIMWAEKACRDLHPAEGNQRLIGYPLTIDNQSIQFSRDSLGLPIALGFMALLTGEPISDELAATGLVREDGAVREVGQLSKKASHARNMGFRVFFFPADNHRPSEIKYPELLPIDNLQQAWMFARLFLPGRAAELLLMESMFKDPVAFINNCHTAPLEWLVWARKNDISRGVRESISKSPELFAMFVEKLGTCLDKGDIVRGEALSKWVVHSSVDRLMDAASPAVFKWFTLNLSMANHRGNVSAADVWQEKADTMVKNASVGDAELFAAFCNHRFICLHHNRYDFSAELPPFLKRILSALEDQYGSQCELLRNATHETLGALYGSIAQNYGFCGPEYLSETRTYCHLAGKAYGDGNAPQLKAHYLRPLNYLIYACLDAGFPDEAEATLPAYLEMDDWQGLRHGLPGFSEWRHAALARFFAAAEKRKETAEYLEWALGKRGGLIEQKHPWQLWLNNMGRVSYRLGDTKSARVFFKESLELCLSATMGPTVQVMGLLPLSGLRRISAVKGLEVDALEKHIRTSAKNLNPNHFRPLLEEADLTVILDNLWARPELLFPFTYR